MALGTRKVGRWSRKAGGRCIRCSFCIELSVHGKTVAEARCLLHQILLYVKKMNKIQNEYIYPLWPLSEKR